MRRTSALILVLPATLAAQPAGLDEGRLDPAWFGPSVTFQPSKALGFQWLKEGLVLQHRSVWIKPWEPVAWRLGKRALKDESLVAQMNRLLAPELTKGLRRGAKDTFPVSQTEGDLVLVGRIADAIGAGDDALFTGMATLSFDLKLVDADTGELLGAFHDTLRGSSADMLSLQFGRWSENLGRLLAPLAVIPAEAKAGVPASATPALPVPPGPTFDLEGALRRIDALKRDGLISEAEYLDLRKKATERGKGL